MVRAGTAVIRTGVQALRPIGIIRFSSIAVHRPVGGPSPTWDRPVLRQPVHEVVCDSKLPGLPGEVGKKGIAKRNIMKGEVVFQASGTPSSEPAMHSVQIDVDRHLNISGDLRFTSHSSCPNLRVRIIDDDLTSHPIDFVAIRDISAGEALSFDYTANEWDMDAGFFDVESGMEVRGFKHLSEGMKIERLLSGTLPSHILQLWLLETKGRVN